MTLLDPSARQRIEAAIQEVEQHTSSEIVVATVPASDSYAEIVLGYGLAVALIAAAIAHFIWLHAPVMWLLWLQAGCVLACVLAFRSGFLLRLLTPAQRLEQSVQRRAREAFLEHGLFATRERTGVLILLSELEHRVVILGDVGIDKHVQAAGWQVHVQRMIAGIRAGRAADGICEVIRDIGVVLATHLPQRTDDTNELPNRVRDGND